MNHVERCGFHRNDQKLVRILFIISQKFYNSYIFDHQAEAVLLYNIEYHILYKQFILQHLDQGCCTDFAVENISVQKILQRFK